MVGLSIIGDNGTAPAPDWTLVHLVRSQAANYGERVYATFEQGPPLTFAGLDRESDRFAAALAAHGVAPGERVMALVGNGPQFLIALVGTMKAGAVIVPVNTELRGAFLEHQVTSARPNLLLVGADLLDSFEMVAGHAPSRLVVVGGEPPGTLPGVLAGVPDVTTFDAFMATGGSVPDFVPKPYDIAGIMFTSGTTGPAKGVLLPHGHIHLFAMLAVAASSIGPDDIYYVCMPLFHANGLFMQALASIHAGARIHLVRRFSTSRWLDEVIACRATLTNALGVMPEFLFNMPPDPRDRDHNLRLVMAVPVGPWGRAFEERFGVRILQGFGMTECNMPIWGSLDDAFEPGCAGYPVEDCFDVRVGDPGTDMPLPVGEVGELLIRPKLPGCFSAGYDGMPERTVEAWRNLWFHTGDAARIDARGRFHYVDRIKDCIRRRGENISAFEVEQVLNGHPAVAESAVIGVRVEGAGGEDEVLAVLVPGQGGRPEPSAVLDYCAGRMPRFAVPRFIDFTDSLDKTASGKLRKVDLREAGLPPTAWDRERAGYVLARR